MGKHTQIFLLKKILWKFENWKTELKKIWRKQVKKNKNKKIKKQEKSTEPPKTKIYIGEKKSYL